MITTIEVPHLAEGQKINDFKKVFLASTATLKPEQRLACLPLYIHRTQGERKLAHTAAAKATVDLAFKFLEDIIDGSPCVFTESAKFFNMKPENLSVDCIRSYFFELQEVAVRAEMSNVAFMKRFLTNIPGGKKFYVDNEADIKADKLDTDEKVTNFFKKILPKLKKKFESDTVSPTIKEEPFVFPIDRRNDKAEDIPEWAWELKEEVNNIRTRMQSNESGFGDDDQTASNRGGDQVFAFNKSSGDKKAYNRSKACRICNKMGHWQKSCYKRICNKCNGTGHDADICPSNKSGTSQPKSDSSSNRTQQR
jgi:hypothetical protein